MTQRQAIWNRPLPDGSWDMHPLCARCSSMSNVDLLSRHLMDDPFNGTEPIILVAGEWMHADCAEQAASAVIPELKPEPEPRAEPEPRPWLQDTVPIGCVLGLALLPFGFVWTLPVLTVVAGFGLCWAWPGSTIWTDARAARYWAGDVAGERGDRAAVLRRA